MSLAAPMKGGDGANSYSKNSTYQRDGLIAAESALKEALNESLNLKSLISDTDTFTITDLGCSTGPNTFFAMKTITEIVRSRAQAQGIDHKKLQFQVFFNDITANDFNTLFASLPSLDQRNYFASAVPGSFYDRLFPSGSIHVAYSSSSLHWLAKVPEEVLDRRSPAWNGGRIHYTGGSEAVVRAYGDQYRRDMERFLTARADEIVGGGVIVMHMPGVPDGVVTHDVGISLTFLGEILGDMVKDGLVSQDQVDSLNIPHFYPSVDQMRMMIEKHGCFEIVKMELRNARPNLEVPINMESAILHLRACAEGLVVNHMGSQIGDELFSRAMQQKDKLANMFESAGIEIGAQFFAVLKRK